MVRQSIELAVKIILRCISTMSLCVTTHKRKGIEENTMENLKMIQQNFINASVPDLNASTCCGMQLLTMSPAIP